MDKWQRDLQTAKTKATQNFLNKSLERCHSDYRVFAAIIQDLPCDLQGVSVPKNVILLYGYCGGAVRSILSLFTQEHKSNLKL